MSEAEIAASIVVLFGLSNFLSFLIGRYRGLERVTKQGIDLPPS